MNRSVVRTLRVAIIALFLPAAAFAQRELHWDSLQVTAHLDANGTLQVVETQTMVFTGDWNGGERIFNIRPRQRVTLAGIYRDSGAGWQPLTEDADLDSVDDYAWTDSNTLRWRSRLRSDPPFVNTRLRYELRYDLSGVLVTDGTGYKLDHDFAFPDRDGAIARFELRLTLDPAWQSAEPIRDVYTASNLRPGQSFVLTLPLRFSGTGTPAVLDLSRPPAIRMAVLAVLIMPTLAVAWFFVSEQAKGRFAPLVAEDRIDAAWLREHILKHPAELVGAAWDDRIGQPEVVALLARMSSEGKLRSEASRGSLPSMTLHLKVDRDTLSGYERKLVDALFWGDRTTTTTDQVKSHYKTKGFNPVEIIEKDLESALKAEFPFGGSGRHFRIETLAIFVVGLIALAIAFFEGDGSATALVMLAIGSVLYAGLASLFGAAFRARMDWGRRNALLCLLPGLAAAMAAASFLWYAGSGAIELATTTIVAIACLALAAANTSINSLKSRQHRGGLAARKTLAAAREFFAVQLRQRQPALHDDWYPWVLAFGLNKQMDDWSARAETLPSDHSFRTSSSSTSSSSPQGWTGFAGGRSGGGGGGASWAAAAGSLAAGVSPPSSSSSGSGSSGGGGGGGGGGSSGGGGGGGW